MAKTGRALAAATSSATSNALSRVRSSAGSEAPQEALWNGAPTAIGAVGLAMACAVAGFLSIADHVLEAASDALHGEAAASESVTRAAAQPMPTLIASDGPPAASPPLAAPAPSSAAADAAALDAAMALQINGPAAAPPATASIRPSAGRAASDAPRLAELFAEGELVLIDAADAATDRAAAPETALNDGERRQLRAAADSLAAALAAAPGGDAPGFEIRAFARGDLREDPIAARTAYARALEARRILVDAGVPPHQVRIAVRRAPAAGRVVVSSVARLGP